MCEQSAVRRRHTYGPPALTPGAGGAGLTVPARARRPRPFTSPDAGLLYDGARPPGTDEGAVERPPPGYEELASNAVRHGRPPVRIQPTAHATWRLLDVSDVALDRPPAPATDLDPADGGLGLHLVAHLCGACGSTVTAGCTHVWARIDLTRPGAPGVVPRSRSGR
jgi:hypothetical protein